MTTNNTVEAPLQFTSRLDELETIVSREMAKDFGSIGDLWVKDPAKASLMQQQLIRTQRQRAQERLDKEIADAKAEKEKLNGLLVAYKEQAATDFGAFWATQVSKAGQLPFVARWIFQVDVDEEQTKATGKVVYKPATVIHIEPQQVKQGATRAPKAANGSQAVIVDGKEYASGAQALVALHPDHASIVDGKIKPGVNARRELAGLKHTVASK